MRREREDARACGNEADASDDGDRADRQRYTDAESRNHDVCFGVVAVLKRVIPVIEHLDDGTSDRHRQNRGNSEPSQSHETTV